MRCSRPQVKCKRSAIVLGLIFCLLNFDDFRPLQHPKVEMYTSVEKVRTVNLNRITSCCGCNTMREGPCLLRHPVVEGRDAACYKCGVIDCTKQMCMNRKWGCLQTSRGLKPLEDNEPPYPATVRALTLELGVAILR